MPSLRLPSRPLSPVPLSLRITLAACMFIEASSVLQGVAEACDSGRKGLLYGTARSTVYSLAIFGFKGKSIGEA